MAHDCDEENIFQHPDVRKSKTAEDCLHLPAFNAYHMRPRILVKPEAASGTSVGIRPLTIDRMYRPKAHNPAPSPPMHHCCSISPPLAAPASTNSLMHSSHAHFSEFLTWLCAPSRTTVLPTDCTHSGSVSVPTLSLSLQQFMISTALSPQPLFSTRAAAAMKSPSWRSFTKNLPCNVPNVRPVQKGTTLFLSISRNSRLYFLSCSRFSVFHCTSIHVSYLECSALMALGRQTCLLRLCSDVHGGRKNCMLMMDEHSIDSIKVLETFLFT